PLVMRGRRESRAPTAPVDPVRRSTRASHVRSTWANTTGTARTSRLSPRNGFTTYFVLSPGKRPFLPPLPAGLTADVAPGSRRQDHTISPYAAAFRPHGLKPH